MRIEGSKVVLRLFTAMDLADYLRWNEPHWLAHQYDGPWYDEDLSDVIAGRARWLAGKQLPPYRFLELETADGKHIGWVTSYLDESTPHSAEVGISIMDDNLWGSGIGTEALQLWVSYLFTVRDLTRIGFTTWSGNKGMMRVGEKLGFSLEGRRRKGVKVRGEFHDLIHMGILREEWVSSPDPK